MGPNQNMVQMGQMGGNIGNQPSGPPNFNNPQMQQGQNQGQNWTGGGMNFWEITYWDRCMLFRVAFATMLCNHYFFHVFFMCTSHIFKIQSLSEYHDFISSIFAHACSRCEFLQSLCTILHKQSTALALVLVSVLISHNETWYVKMKCTLPFVLIRTRPSLRYRHLLKVAWSLFSAKLAC